MAQLNNKFLSFILCGLICLMGLTTAASAARIDEMDYDSLISMLAEAESQSNYDAAEDTKAESNNLNYYASANVASGNGQQVIDNSQRLGSNIDFTITKPSAASLVAPHVEFLRIVESFFKLKGEMASRIHALISDNFDLFRSVYNLIVSKTAKLHSFTLIGISVIRKILEFAVQMIGTWEVSAPSVSFGFNKIFNAMA